jgi:hypothetical protein
MSDYKFIASNEYLPEIDLTGVQKLKVKDMIRMNIKPGSIPWTELNEEAGVLYTEDKDAFDNLQISECTNPPYGVDEYIQLKHLNRLEGNLKSKSCLQLYDYLNNLSENTSVELWSIWFGNGKQQIDYKHIKRSELNYIDLEFLLNRNCCLVLE